MISGAVMIYSMPDHSGLYTINTPLIRLRQVTQSHVTCVLGRKGLINNMWFRWIPAEAPVFHRKGRISVQSRLPQTGLLFHISGNIYSEFQQRTHVFERHEPSTVACSALPTHRSRLNVEQLNTRFTFSTGWVLQGFNAK